MYYYLLKKQKKTNIKIDKEYFCTDNAPMSLVHPEGFIAAKKQGMYQVTLWKLYKIAILRTLQAITGKKRN
ncbi:hypothetical protein FACS1894199_05690 [Bacteroidia bacterium]|nr:hypothetical protein FACS1894199_05690 [Bacteroidia bacterium]